MTKREALTVLGLRLGSSDAQIKAAYRKLAKQTHPDTGGKRRDFERVTRAYRILTGREREDTTSAPSTPWIQ